MLDLLDAVFLARLQFAFVVSFHIIFPAFTIGLSSWLAVLEWRWLQTGDKTYERLYKFWIKIFAICFGLGVVSGVVMSYQFGTNWSVFSDKIANVIGPLFGYEVLTAFFLEASFLGIMLFGWGRVSKRMHFVATCVVAGGTLLSAFWILAANSWMQTPQGFTVAANGQFLPASWFEIIFNPSFPYRFSHMVTAAYLTTAFVVAGVGGYYLRRQRHLAEAKVMFAMAMLMAVFIAPLQLFIGHLQGENTLKHQPLKIAAMEANWEKGTNKPLLLFALPMQNQEENRFELKVSNGASLVLTGKASGEVPGLKEVPKAERPPVAVVFWAFRVMVGMGILMAATGVFAVVLYFRKRLFETVWFQLWCMTLTPAGFIAVLAGWFVTEVGRQPYTVYGVLHTADSASPVLVEQVAISLIAFVMVYSFVFGAGIYYISKLIRKGPSASSEDANYYEHSIEATMGKQLADKLSGGGHA